MGECRYPGYVLRHVAGEWNLLDLTHPDVPYTKPLKLNETAAQTWEYLNDGKSQEEIAKIFSEEYAVSYDVIFSDVSDLIEQFRTYGVLI